MLRASPQVERLALDRHMLGADRAAAGHRPAARPAGGAGDGLPPALDARRFGPFLLAGVTGSGKTEVYLRAAERGARRADAAVILLVPEIALVPALAARRVERRFGERARASCTPGSATASAHQEWERVRARRGAGGARAALGPVRAGRPTSA